MKIVKPSVKLVLQTDLYEHIAHAAHICYAADDNSNSKQFIDNCIKNNHLSVLRHGTVYFKVPIDDIFYFKYRNTEPYSYVDWYNNFSYISTNMQVIYDNNWMDDLKSEFVITEEQLKQEYPKFEGFRYSFEIVTQLSTSRELNRVSPNNICEQSTRYCNFSKNKFGNEVTICQPHWFNIFTENRNENECLYIENTEGTADLVFNEKFYCLKDIQDDNILAIYLRHANDSCKAYLELIKLGMLPEDARGVLPIDVATKVFYTYTVQEWKSIIDKRYYGKIGKPHPNAVIVTNMIRKELNKLGYEL